MAAPRGSRAPFKRRVYTDEEKAQAFLVLTVNDGNVKRSARDLGIPVSSLRNWVSEWDREGVPTEIQEAAAQDAGDWIEDATRVRDKALRVAETKLGEATLSALMTTVGILDDKITRAKGLATTRTVVQHELPSADEIRDALVAAMQGALSAAKERHDIIDVEVRSQPKALLPG